MFVDEVKVFARAGHGGKGCVAFLREAYRPKGGPAGGNGGRGGDVILQADHDLNNLINQFYSPRLIAEDGQFGMGKGMDGHAGKDIIVRVPCGTVVWRLPASGGAAIEAPAEGEEPEQRKPMLLAASQRPVIRHAGSARAMEIDLSAEEQVPAHLADSEKGELIADLTGHEQRFVLCKGG